MNILLSTTYFGPIQWYQKLYHADEALIERHAGNGVWENNATIWVKEYAVAGAKYEINLPDDELEDLKKKVADKGKNQIYYEYMFQFKIPGLDNQYFTTKLFKTTAVDIK